MFTSIRNRLIVLGVLLLAAIIALVPRDVTTRARDPKTGAMVDHKVRRVPLNLGLDLQGGMHLALELDQSKQVSADPKRDLELALQILRKRVDEFGVTEPLIQKVGDSRIVVELAGITDPARAKSIVQQSAFLEFRITDKTDALTKALPAMDRALRNLGIKAPGDAEAKPSAVQQILGGDTTKKGAADSAAAGTGVLTGLIQQAPGGVPGEYMVAETAFPRVDSLLSLPDVQRALPRGVVLRWSGAAQSVGVQQYRFLYALADKAIITGDKLVDANASFDQLTNGPVVNFELDRAGGRRFGEETGKNVGNFMAILLDGRVEGRPPVIESRIDRNGRITLGNRSIQEAQDLALTLRAGALPIPLKIVEERQVGASLGADSIRDGIIAGVVGTALVILIMLGYYALSGVLAVGALALYLVLALGGLAMFGSTLTLPGIAGLILSVGIAVDANVLIFERIREELQHGKTVRLAVDEGFRHAMPAIIDSNLATVLTALFLFQFGTGPVKGFAVTLIVGIIASMITAVFATRTFYMIWLRRHPSMQTLSVGKVRLFANASFDFIKLRRWAYGVTAAFIVPALALLAFHGGLNYSIEFTGGTLVQIQSDKVDVAALRGGLDRAGLHGAEITQFGAPGEYVIRARVEKAATDANNTQITANLLHKALDTTLGAGHYKIVRTEAVGPKVGGELQRQAILAILLSFLAVLAYLAYRFEWRFGLAAVVATAHDIIATLAFIGAMKLEVSLVVVAGVLTMVGYSLNDTIIIFDRVRENLKKHQRMSFKDILNLSINETLPRSILTHGTTLSTLLALAIFGGEVIRPFALVMFFGVFTGTFSSIYIASPVLMWIEQRWPGPAARALRGGAGKAPAPAGTRSRPQPVG